LVDALQERDTVDLFANMAPDDRVWLLDELPASVASKLLRGLEPGERDQTAVLLGYPEDSIGRRMSPRFITLRPWHTVAEAMGRCRESLEEADSICCLPVVASRRE